MTALAAVACYLPPDRVPVADVAGRLGLDRIQVRMLHRVHGLSEVRLHRSGGLAGLLRAAADRLDGLGGNESRVRYVIHGRSLPVVVPYPANPLHELCRDLGLTGAVAFTVTQQACASGLTAIDVAGKLLEAAGDPQALALVLTGEKVFCDHSRWIPGTTIFGEAAAACLVRPGGGRDRLLASVNSQHGEFDGNITRESDLAKAFQRAYPTLLAKVICDVVRRAGLRLSDIALVLPHNVNTVSWRRLCRQLDYPVERVVLDNVAVTGHTFCADAFVNYRTAVESGRLRAGDRYLMVAVGSGATFTAMAFEH